MIRASELRGRAVVDVELAEKIGHIEEILLDPAGARIAGFVVTEGATSLFGGAASRIYLHASAVHAIGPDALTVRKIDTSEAEAAAAPLAQMPHMSEVVGRKTVTQNGAMLGTIEDILLDPATGRIVGYALGSTGPLSKLENLLGGPKETYPDYIRGDADLRVGKDVVVVPDAALVRGGQDRLPESDPAGDWQQSSRP